MLQTAYSARIASAGEWIDMLKKLWAQVWRFGAAAPLPKPIPLGDLPEAVREYLRAFESGDVATLARWVAPDVDHVQVGDDGDPTTERAMIQGLGLDGVKAVIEGLHEMMRDFRIEVYEAGAYEGELDVWSVKFMLCGVWQKTIPRGFQAGQHVRLPGHIVAKVVDGRIVRLRERM
jgi:ketosteroid isomerase-like protein